MIVLDTDHLTLLEWRDRAETVRLRERLKQCSQPVFATIISYEEQARGRLGKLSKAKNQAALIEAYRRLLLHLNNYKEVQLLPYDEPCAVEFQRLRKLLPRLGTMDLRIAAVVLVYKGILLTKNRSDFLQVPGLSIEDWTL